MQRHIYINKFSLFAVPSAKFDKQNIFYFIWDMYFIHVLKHHFSSSGSYSRRLSRKHLPVLAPEHHPNQGHGCESVLLDKT